jgi:hypothetical protein
MALFAGLPNSPRRFSRDPPKTPASTQTAPLLFSIFRQPAGRRPWWIFEIERTTGFAPRQRGEFSVDAPSSARTKGEVAPSLRQSRRRCPSAAGGYSGAGGDLADRRRARGQPTGAAHMK